MARRAHPGRGDTTLPAAALTAVRRPAELSLTDLIDLLGPGTVQTETGAGTITTVPAVATEDVPARIEPQTRTADQTVVGADPSTIERWTIEVPHGTPAQIDQYAQVVSSTNPRLQGARLRIVSELDSSTEPLRRFAATFVNRGEG